MIEWKHLMYEKEMVELLLPHIDKVVGSHRMEDYNNDHQNSYNVNTLV